MKITNIYLITIAVLLMFINSCTYNRHCEIDNNNLRTILMTEFTKKGWDFEIGRNIEDIKSTLGKPLSEVVENINNLHDQEQIDQIHTLKYTGLEIKVHHVNYIEPYDLIIEVTIDDDSFYPMKYGLKIGSSKQDVMSLLGKPLKANGDVMYQIEEGDTYPTVTFHFDNGILKKVKWEWYPD
jgi:hypothetical protein